MLNPHQEPEHPLADRARLHMKAKSVPRQIKTLVEETFAEFLQKEPVVLTRNEKRRLRHAVVKEIFDDILAGMQPEV